MGARAGTAAKGSARQGFSRCEPPADRVEGVVAVVSAAVALLGLPVVAAIGSRAYVAQAVTRADDDHRPARALLTVEGVVATAAAVAGGVWLALGGGTALLCVLAHSAHTRARRHRSDVERAAVEPDWRKTA
ncbi:hypothetical protein ACFV4N_42210 [Actinosynnema sp. NPDC059797]